MFTDGHRAVDATKVTRYNRAHHGQVDCWLYHTKLNDDGLLGSRDQYTVGSLVSSDP